MYCEALRVTDIGQMAEQLQALYEFSAGSGAARYAETQYGADTLRQVAAGTFMIWVTLQPGIFHPLDLGVLFQKLGHCLRVLGVALHAQAQGLYTLQGLPAVEWRRAAAYVAQHVHPCLDRKWRQPH